MILFVNDYQEGCLPEILQKMNECNSEQNAGYGLDVHSENARELIRKKIENPNADVHFVTGGTLTNKLVITTFLKGYEGVLCPDTAHIATHETGAIEQGGHKVLTLKNANGKITAEQVESTVNEHIAGLSREHTVKPGMVYVSQSTEIGTIYSLAELKALSEVCKKHGLLFFMDGARLLTALFSKPCDFTLKDICGLCDLFYIGGTKAGALFGEALVICNDKLKGEFRYALKQNGALLAKGFALGIQFEGLMQEDAYAKYLKNAVKYADAIRDTLKNKGIALENESYDTQTFAIFTQKQYEKLAKTFNFGGATVINGLYHARICTSWATKEQAVNQLISAINEL